MVQIFPGSSALLPGQHEAYAHPLLLQMLKMGTGEATWDELLASDL